MFVVIAVGAGVLAPTASAAGPAHGRHYEMATPADKLGQPTTVAGLSPDGDTVRFSTTGGNGLPGTEGQTPVINSYVARRDAHQWGYFPMNLPTAQIADGFYLDATPAFDVQLFRGVTDLPTRTSAFFLRRPGGAPDRISPEIANRGGGTPPNVRPLFAGSSADLTHVLFYGQGSTGGVGNEVAYLASDPAPEPDGFSPRKLYESVAGDPGTVRRVDVDTGGAPVGGACAGQGALQTWLGSDNQAERAVSADGRRVFFTTSPDCVDRRVYARVNGTTTVELSATECDRVADPGATPPVTACASRSGDEQYESASADGRAVYFTSPNQLVDGDVDSTLDFYRYDFDAPSGAKLSMVSAGNNATPEAGADLRGVVRVSQDGNRAYFVAGAELTSVPNGQGQTAAAGENNLYRYEASDDSVHFVAKLDAFGDGQIYGLDAFRPAHLADSEGRFLVFPSVAQLTADDTDGSQDIYRYDAEADQLRRVSVGHDGFGTDGNDETAALVRPVPNSTARVSVPSEVRTVTADGQRILFVTSEALQADDVNNAPDIYEWANGDVGLISDGTTAIGTADQAFGLEKGFMISADGNAVTFSTSTRLLPSRDTDTASDVYVARVGPDVDPLPQPPNSSCVGAACQPPGPSAPHLPPAGSVTFSGGGNALVPLAPMPTKISVKSAKAVRGSRGGLTVTVPASGSLTASGVGLTSVKRRVAKAGSYTVKVSLSKRARKTLSRKGTVRTKVKIAFAPTLGTKASTQVSLTFKATRKKGRS